MKELELHVYESRTGKSSATELKDSEFEAARSEPGERSAATSGASPEGERREARAERCAPPRRGAADGSSPASWSMMR